MAIKTCRFCLALNVKVFKLGNSEKKYFIENIFKQHGYIQELHEEHYICFECKALLHKSYKFIRRVLKAQNILACLAKENTKITPSCFKQIDRQLLSYNLVTDLKGIDVFLSEDVDKIKNESTPNLKEDKLKVEIEDYDMLDPLENPIDDFNYDMKEVEIDFGYNFKDDYTDSKSDIDIPFDDNNLDEEIDYKPFHDNTVTYDFNETTKDTIEYEFIEQIKEEIIDGNDTIIINNNKKKSSRLSKKTFKPKNSKKTAKKVKPPSKASKNVKTKSCRTDGSSVKKSKRSKPKKHNYDGRVDLNRQVQQPVVPKYPAKCDHCNYEVPNRTAHFHHYLLEHKDKKYPYAQQTGKQFVCQFCGLVNDKKSRHIDHELTHGNVNNFNCSQCSKSFANKHRLRKHTYRAHPLQMLECDYCGKKVKCRESLMIHIRAHTGERPFKCPFCGAGFAHRGNIRPHIRANHEQCLDQSDLAIRINKRKTTYEATDTKILAPDNGKLCASEMFMHLSTVMNMNNNLQ